MSVCAPHVSLCKMRKSEKKKIAIIGHRAAYLLLHNGCPDYLFHSFLFDKPAALSKANAQVKRKSRENNMRRFTALQFDNEKKLDFEEAFIYNI